MTDATYATVIDAVFAMDAYEHDAGTGFWSRDLKLFFPNLVEDQLGNYVVSDVSTEGEETNNNFFAIAYATSGSTIVSYRGTTAVVRDAINGYGIATGSPFGPDAADAVGFYQEVANHLGEPLQGAPGITVVGHSLVRLR